MWNIILTDLIPIIFIMLLGYFSGKNKAFAFADARIFNKLVLNYALPAALFVSIVKADRSMLFEDIKLTVISAVVIIGVFMWAYFSCYKFFKHSKGEAAVCALIAGSPTIGFLGFAVLDPIFGATATTGLVIAIVSIIVNAVTIPLGLSLLNAGNKAAGVPNANTAPAVATTPDGQPVHENVEKRFVGWAHKHAVANALIQPVCWVPILAVIIVLLGIKFPPKIDPCFDLIAKANAGVAVFAAGLTLSGMKFQFNGEILYNTFTKLILMPGILLIVGWLFKMEADKLQMLVLAGALPPAFSGVIISSRYNTYVRTGTSSLAISIIGFMATAPLWIWLSRLVGS